MFKTRVCWVLPLIMASTAGAAWADTDLRIYGNADVSIDEINNGLKWGTFVSSNLSYIGFAAQHDLNADLKIVAQIEGQADIAASSSVKDTFGFRNSFLGFASKQWGAIKAGKSDTPYKTSTAVFDPFSGTIGDYNAIMGNTGGDGRVEFDQRVSHAIWYESPALGPVTFTFMWSPGQNAAGDSSDFPLGDNVCTGSTFGGNGSGDAGVQNAFGGSPGTGRQITGGPAGGVGSTIGTGFGECTDGAFGDLYSGNVIFKSAGLIAIASGELHHSVNRVSDGIPSGSTATNEFGNSNVNNATEWAAKAGIGYDFGVIKVYAAGEYMKRTQTPSGFNERTRYGAYGSATYRFTPNDEFSIAYAHAFKTPGNPGVNTVNGAFCPGGDATQDDASDLYAAGLRHYFTPAISVYFVGAWNHNDQCAHYGLGQSGHGLVYLSRNQFNETFAGKDIYGVSFGSSFRF